MREDESRVHAPRPLVCFSPLAFKLGMLFIWPTSAPPLTGFRKSSRSRADHAVPNWSGLGSKECEGGPSYNIPKSFGYCARLVFYAFNGESTQQRYIALLYPTLFLYTGYLSDKFGDSNSSLIFFYLPSAILPLCPTVCRVPFNKILFR